MTGSAVAHEGDPHPRPFRDRAAVQRRTMVVLLLTQVIGTVGVGVAPSIGVLLAGEVTQNEAWAGLARTASTLGAALLGLPLGDLAARRGRRFALSVGWWIAALGAAILVAAAQWSLVVPLFLGLLLIGSGSAVSLQSRFAATDLAEPHRKARSLSLVVWVGTIGSVLGPNLGAPGRLVGERTGLTVYASAFLIAAGCLALAGLVVFALLRPDPLLVHAQMAREEERGACGCAPSGLGSGLGSVSVSGPGLGRAAAGAGSPAPAVLRPGRIRAMVDQARANPQARFAILAILTAQVVMVAVMTMTPVHIRHEGGTVDLVGITISLHVLGMYALAPLVGWLTDRRGNLMTIWIGVVTLAVSMVIGAALGSGAGWTIVALVLLGVGWSFVNVSASALFSMTVPQEARASSQGGVDALANLCGASVAFMAGPLMAVSSFSVLSLIGVVLLVPLVWALVRVGGQGPARTRGGLS